jgi:hypothetical protein
MAVSISSRASDELAGSGHVTHPDSATLAKRRAAIFSVLVVLVVLSPILQNWHPEATDNFPLSYYPMFSYERPELERLNYLVGLDSDGRRFGIPYTQAGSGGMNQVRRQINTRVSRNQSDVLCRSVSQRIARSRLAYYAGIQTVQVVTGDYDLNEFFTSSRSPRSEQVRASCPVQRQQ